MTSLQLNIINIKVQISTFDVGFLEMQDRLAKLNALKLSFYLSLKTSNSLSFIIETVSDIATDI